MAGGLGGGGRIGTEAAMHGKQVNTICSKCGVSIRQFLTKRTETFEEGRGKEIYSHKKDRKTI